MKKPKSRTSSICIDKLIFVRCGRIECIINELQNGNVDDIQIVK